MVIGNLGNAPELKYTANGVAYANFRVAVNAKSKDGEETQWYRVTVWRATAEACSKYLTVGSQVFVEGTLKASIYGENKISLDIEHASVQFLTNDKSKEKENVDTRPGEADAPRVSDPDDIPF